MQRTIITLHFNQFTQIKHNFKIIFLNDNFSMFHSFIHFAITNHLGFHSGVSAMEIVAMDMKLRGMYIARQLSFKGVTFTVHEVPFSDEFTKVFNESVDLVSNSGSESNLHIFNSFQMTYRCL